MSSTATLYADEYAFVAAKAVEGALFIHRGGKEAAVPLSVQAIIDCSWGVLHLAMIWVPSKGKCIAYCKAGKAAVVLIMLFGNRGNDGGSAEAAFEWMMKHGLQRMQLTPLKTRYVPVPTSSKWCLSTNQQEWNNSRLPHLNTMGFNPSCWVVLSDQRAGSYFAIQRGNAASLLGTMNSDDSCYIDNVEIETKVKGYYKVPSNDVNALKVRRNNNLLLTICKILRGESDCPELVGRVVRLFVPEVPRIGLRPRSRPLLAVPAARTRTVSRRSSPLPRALTLLNALLTAAPECDLLACPWSTLAIVNHGPVVVMFDHMNMFYSYGIYNETGKCLNDPGSGNRQGLVIGYGSADDQEYWILMIDNGIVQIVTRDNTCGVMNAPIYVTVE
ncbi:hypothetical protein MSG28_013939 [Choristoneura fumiferana]|uniref:Uncharacterized protein n=1 Tax=Choristoneura fumiferana TaxID=7141 RepID=A0ACC0KAK0_CHOFU|nr:hypothetical protein MSG28_013939 [Choristoneura fumiferana]